MSKLRTTRRERIRLDFSVEHDRELDSVVLSSRQADALWGAIKAVICASSTSAKTMWNQHVEISLDFRKPVEPEPGPIEPRFRPRPKKRTVSK